MANGEGRGRAESRIPDKARPPGSACKLSPGGWRLAPEGDAVYTAEAGGWIWVRAPETSGGSSRRGEVSPGPRDDSRAADLGSAPHARHLSVWFAVRGAENRRIRWDLLPFLWGLGVLTQSLSLGDPQTHA